MLIVVLVLFLLFRTYFNFVIISRFYESYAKDFYLKSLTLNSPTGDIKITHFNKLTYDWLNGSYAQVNMWDFWQFKH